MALRAERWTGWFAMALVLAATACSESTAEGPPNPGSEVSSPGGSVLTSLDGHIVGDSDHPGYAVDVPEGWSVSGGFFVVKSGADVVGMSVWDVAQVPGHPCHWQRTMTAVGPTVDDLVDALSSQQLRDPTEPTDVTLAGHHGRYLELSVPSDWIVTGDANFKGCDDPGNGHQDFVSWLGRDAGDRYQQVAGQVDRLWVLDVAGQTLLVDATYTPATSEAVREELEQVVASIRFAGA